jgi:protein-disulfide isomerase
MRLFALVGFSLFLFSASAQVSVLESIDTTGFSALQKKTLTSVLQSQNCTCGCNWTIAKCRNDDPKCGYSRQLLNLVIKDLKAGKDEKQIVADLKLHAETPPPVLDDPVSINIQGDPVMGPDNAKITIVEFSDFQCPYCAAAVVQAKMILEKYPKDVRLVFKQFPLDDHSQAALAAQAAVAAHAQGKFWEMHDKLYGNYRTISAQNILLWAKEIGLDMKRFVEEVDSGKYKTEVENEVKQGEVAGVQGTPTFFFNGRRYSGAFQADAIAQMLQKEFLIPPPK